MTKDELMKDAEAFKDKPGFGYVHTELKDGKECSLLIAGDRNAIEGITYNLLIQLAEKRGMPLPMYLAILLTKFDGLTDDADSDDDLIIE